MTILVSVIIPTYNCESYIAETVDCVLAQNYPFIELIVVDDGSTDKTIEIIRSYGQIVKLINQKNSGVCSARNKGIREAKGKYICFMDHDDYWYPDKISSQINAFERYPDVGIVYSNFILWHSNSEAKFPNPDSFSHKLIKEGVDQDFSGWIYHQLLLDCWVLTSTAMLSSEVFENCGVFDESLPYSEDWDLWLRVSRKYRFLKLKKETTLYRQHTNQGNKKVRPIDYRTLLLTNSVQNWGLCSQDGRCLSKNAFYRQLAEYHSAFGLHHLRDGDKKIALASLFKAWISFPLKFKYVAYCIAGILGWKPHW